MADEPDCGTGGTTCRPPWVWNPPIGNDASEAAVSSGMVFLTADQLPPRCLTATGGPPVSLCVPPGRRDPGIAPLLGAQIASRGLSVAAGDRAFAFHQSCVPVPTPPHALP